LPNIGKDMFLGNVKISINGTAIETKVDQESEDNFANVKLS
jgi:hypothetical protein